MAHTQKLDSDVAEGKLDTPPRQLASLKTVLAACIYIIIMNDTYIYILQSIISIYIHICNNKPQSFKKTWIPIHKALS